MNLNLKNPLVFFVIKDSTFQYKNIASLKEKNIGIIRGYTYGAEFDSSTHFTKEISESHASSFLQLNTNRIDAYLCDKRVGIYIATTLNILDNIKIINEPFTLMYGRIGFTKQMGRAPLTREHFLYF